MTSEVHENEAHVRRLLEAFNERNREEFDECYADPLVVHSRDGDRALTHDEHWEEVLGLFGVFPDLHAEFHSVVAEEDRVMYRCTYTATHEGPIGDVEPTGKEVEWDLWTEYRLEDGVIAEAWQLFDTLHLYEELGLIEVPDL